MSLECPPTLGAQYSPWALPEELPHQLQGGPSGVRSALYTPPRPLGECRHRLRLGLRLGLELGLEPLGECRHRLRALGEGTQGGGFALLSGEAFQELGHSVETDGGMLREQA